MKYRILLLALILITFLSACNSRPSVNDPEVNIDDTIEDMHGKVKNAERLEKFYQNTLYGKKDNISIIRYTTEGDPIFHDLGFDGNEIKYTYDNSKDKFGEPDIKSAFCKSLLTSMMENGNEYSLQGCYGNNKEIGQRFKFLIVHK
jgi:hypothetical protein